jgi:HSP20 family protein
MSISFVRWQPWQEMETVRRQLDHLFEEMAPLTRDSLSTTVNRAVRVPAIELIANDHALLLRAELPGLEPEDLEIQVTREAVSIKGTKRSQFTEEPKASAETNAEATTQQEGQLDVQEAPVAPAVAPIAPQLAAHQVYRSEFRYGSFHRVIALPLEVDPDQVTADFKQGILTLTLPKLERDRNRVVKVSL